MKTVFKFVDEDELRPVLDRHFKSIYANEFNFNTHLVFDDFEKEKTKEHFQNLKELYRYKILAIQDGIPIGWSFGIQSRADHLYMTNSAILPEYRNKGVYSEMLDHIVKQAKKDGFQRIFSNHKMGNNAILIPKLKYGFVISGFEIDDQFGPLIQLSYYTNKRRKELLDVRFGMRKPDEEDLNLIP